MVGGWDQKSWGRGVELGVWSRGGGGWGRRSWDRWVGIEGIEVGKLKSGGWSQEDWCRRSCGWGMGSEELGSRRLELERVGVGGVEVNEVGARRIEVGGLK